MPHMPSSSHKNIIITGASRGIGRALALEAASRHMRVIAIARTQGALEALHDEIIALQAPAPTMIAADLAGHDFNDKAAHIIQQIYERDGKCDYFIANGGILGMVTPLCLLEPEQLAKVMRVNVYANHIMVRYLLGLLQRSTIGRVAFVSSGMAKSAPPFYGAYSISKAALDNLNACLKKEWQDSHIDCVSYNPGATNTAMYMTAMPGADSTTLNQPADVAKHLIDVITQHEPLPVEAIYS